MKKILVIGSINMDLIVNTDEIPGVGETLTGNELLQIPGGKGANQGVSMAKLGGDVTFLGKVGKDAFGEESLKSMNAAGVKTESIDTIDGVSTGIAVINVDKKGNNNIVVIPGANGEVDEDYLEINEETFKETDVVVFQFEIPLETVKRGLELSKKYDKLTIVNPAPAMELDEEMIANIDILVPNEHELARMAKMKVVDEKTTLEASKKLLDKGIEQIVVTLGSKGVMVVNKEGSNMYPAYEVKVVDTTAAGDSFIGGFTTSYVNDKDIEKAVELGQKTAALAIQKMGAQSSLPTKEDVEEFHLGGVSWEKKS